MNDNVTRIIDGDGSTFYRNEHNMFHCEDGPAIQYFDGSLEWWVNGVPHREDGPAVADANGNMEWWVNGTLHREDGPAIIYSTGEQEWWVHGKHIR